MSIHFSIQLLKYFALPVNAMGKLQGRGIILYDLRRALIIPEKSIPEKRVLYCMYVVSIVAYQDYQDRCRPIRADLTKGFHTRGTECACAQEVHGWLLSGSEEFTILCCSFLTRVANK